MKWEMKMDFVVSEVLGEDFYVNVINDHEFQILEGNHVVAYRETLESLKSHWRKNIKEVLMTMYDEKVTKNLSRV